MIFQPLDKKRECKLFYYDGQLNEQLPSSATATWKYLQHLDNLNDVKYANLFCEDKSLNDVCPEHLKYDWKKITDRLKAYMRAFSLAKINTNDICFFDSVPEMFLLKYFDLKNQITEHILKNFPEPENYDFLLSLTRLAETIKNKKLNIDAESLNLGKYKTRQFVKKIKKINHCIEYNIFGTKTGRLTTKPNSFPIMTLDRDHRSVLKPRNDVFVELDYNAAELRVFMGLLGIPQPKEDIHAWIGQSVFKGGLSRDVVKKKVFAWLYNPQAKDRRLEKIFNKDKILEKCYDGQQVSTPFKRIIEADDHHALNYVIQSTTSDMFLRQVVEVSKILDKTNSYIAFSIHDSFIIDLKREDKPVLDEVVKTFSKTIFGDFKINLSIGKDFGNMIKIDTI
jgi:hypothetical protein